MASDIESKQERESDEREFEGDMRLDKFLLYDINSKYFSYLRKFAN